MARRVTTPIGPRTKAGRAFLARKHRPKPTSEIGQASREADRVAILAIEREAAGAATETGGLDPRQLAQWWVDAHLSNEKGLEANVRLAAFWEDWWAANMDEPWPLPRVARLSVHPDREDAPDGGGAT